MKILKTAMLLLLAITLSIGARSQTGVVDYPVGFRAWQHVKTAMILPGHPLEETFGGIHHIYANENAMHGLTGGDYEEGAVLVFDLLDYTTADFFVAEAARKRIDVMQYDAGRFSETGNWGFASFVGDKMVEQDVVTACYACHIPAKETSFVYSKYRQ
jgi:hypothetical protein